MDNHPGGKEILLLAAGRDITYAFDSYHPFTDKAEKSKWSLPPPSYPRQPSTVEKEMNIAAQ